MIKSLKIGLLFAIAILIGMSCMAQRDGGGKKKKTVKTEQTQSTLRNQKQSQSNKKKTQSSAKVSEPDGYINSHGYVDLGLPSGLKWATCNVGASTPSDYGNYYAWGETKHKSLYSETNSLTTGKNIFELQAENIIDSSGNLSISYDVARASWKGTWRMPSKEEFEELINKCTWKWINQNGHNGYKVIDPNGKSIFIPAAGDKTEDSLNLWGGTGVYIHKSPRWFGLPIRPVT